jgi:hypothetical protein
MPFSFLFHRGEMFTLLNAPIFLFNRGEAYFSGAPFYGFFALSSFSLQP